MTTRAISKRFPNYSEFLAKEKQQLEERLARLSAPERRAVYQTIAEIFERSGLDNDYTINNGSDLSILFKVKPTDSYKHLKEKLLKPIAVQYKKAVEDPSGVFYTHLVSFNWYYISNSSDKSFWLRVNFQFPPEGCQDVYFTPEQRTYVTTEYQIHIRQ